MRRWAVVIVALAAMMAARAPPPPPPPALRCAAQAFNDRVVTLHCERVGPGSTAEITGPDAARVLGEPRSRAMVFLAPRAF